MTTYQSFFASVSVGGGQFVMVTSFQWPIRCRGCYSFNQ